MVRPVLRLAIDADSSSCSLGLCLSAHPAMSLLERAAAFLHGNSEEEATTKRASASPSLAAAAAAATAASAAASRRPWLLPSLPSLRACCFLFVSFVLLRVLVGGGSYSGAGRPAGSPIGGDFEAQRHWMEVTLHLGAGEWYAGAHALNDLQYWGLDYPPLTAYLSKLFGAVAHSPFVGLQQLVELGASRGHESPEGKLFMRLTVLLSDVLVALPGIVLALAAINAAAPASTAATPATRTATQTRNTVLMYLALIHPAFILIDHGHFQSAQTHQTNQQSHFHVAKSTLTRVLACSIFLRLQIQLCESRIGCAGRVLPVGRSRVGGFGVLRAVADLQADEPVLRAGILRVLAREDQTRTAGTHSNVDHEVSETKTTQPASERVSE